MAKPPHLKDSRECGTCSYYKGPQEGRGRCTMYDYPVGEDEVCDSWAAGDPEQATRALWSKHRKRMKELSNG